MRCRATEPKTRGEREEQNGKKREDPVPKNNGRMVPLVPIRTKERRRSRDERKKKRQNTGQDFPQGQKKKEGLVKRSDFPIYSI